VIYFDNAATSYPKPFEVIRAVNEAFTLYGANPGRSGHDLSVRSAMKVYEAREKLNRFFNGYGSEFVSFFPNCTYALNVAIQGIVKKGEHIVISSLEHNSVARPVHYLERLEIADYSVFKVGKTDEETLWNFKKELRENTKVCIVTAVSNVFGNILPIKALAEAAHQNGSLFFVDGAQGAGYIEIDMKNQGIDCLCLPGHKGLLGPMGTGALLHRNLDFEPIISGGTGSLSFEKYQPDVYPERLESGTLNVPGICGLSKGIDIVNKIGVKRIFDYETALCKELFYGLKSIDGIELYREKYDELHYAPIVSFNVKGVHSERVASALARNGIAVRGGFHCSPYAHSHYSTGGVGAVRVSPSLNNSKKDINIVLKLLRKIALSEII